MPQLDKDPQVVAEMFDGIAQRYDITNDVLSLGLTRKWRHEVTREIDPRPGMDILDLAAGTGTSSVPLVEAGAKVIAADFSAGMVAEGMRRHPEVDFVQADAVNLPFDDDTFDVVTISFGLRNVVDTERALAEMLRVTKPGGRILICEFSSPTARPLRASYTWYRDHLLPKVAGAVTRKAGSYEYLAESISQWPDQVELGKLMVRSGWTRVAYRNLAGGIVALHRGTRPVADPQ
ncbi:class I SAM-dependent methyltransferase [Rarobacter incanus]|uniref:Demethylmenaquinone methyltransferase n=1 Tax=Rarobacter incanus TaxID=153494 RepID=A0A542SRY3_9MICO|nr:class I SAM-dependent methyltransferase [Rarobacter incanus]TQK77007.1 demethylmenaquinone methyltransferase/2-methoxy-6-polyprenyl-1,4-benzoquinol methylase [Rarobacter incanus]